MKLTDWIWVDNNFNYKSYPARFDAIRVHDANYVFKASYLKKQIASTERVYASAIGIMESRDPNEIDWDNYKRLCTKLLKVRILLEELNNAH